MKIIKDGTYAIPVGEHTTLEITSYGRFLEPGYDIRIKDTVTNKDYNINIPLNSNHYADVDYDKFLEDVQELFDKLVEFMADDTVNIFNLKENMVDIRRKYCD